MRRVVITGLGLVTPLGDGVVTSWQRLIEGRSGIKKISGFDVSDLSTKIAGQVLESTLEDSDLGLFCSSRYVPLKDQRKMDRFIFYAIAAAIQAVQDSGWQPKDEESLEKTGVLIGSGIGGLSEIYKSSVILKEQGPRKVSPFFIPASLINLASGHISIKFGFKGPNHSVVTACATGAHAIGDASRMIQLGDADVMVVGSAEAAICRIGIAGFNACRALSTQFNETPEKASRPWDKDRDGFVMGEGAGVVILEEYSHAKKRGAKIYAEVVGYGMSGDAHHVTAPAEDGRGGYRSMKAALYHAKINPEDIGYINAHGTSTPLGDVVEINAVKNLFKDHAYKLSISSTKSSTGHLLGGAGSVEAIFTALALKEQVVPPTLNLDNPSEGCDLDFVPYYAKRKALTYAMSNSFGFGGTNASLIFKATS